MTTVPWWHVLHVWTQWEDVRMVKKTTGQPCDGQRRRCLVCNIEERRVVTTEVPTTFGGVQREL